MDCFASLAMTTGRQCSPLMLAVHVVDHDTQKRLKDGVMVGVRTTITY
jgi:hypothetical protein